MRFQPEFSLATGEVVAAEALVRWQHPTRGLLEPDDFIPFAEESSLILALDRHVLREACRSARRWSQLRRWRDRVVVSVNLSPRFIRQPDVVADITATLREVDADPRCLQIEITERTALTDIDRTVDTLQALRLLGVRVAIDDFGTGYSSLSYLKRLPIDVVKLDRAFVESMDVLESDVAIVQAVITMAHALGMKVTAEGVERVEQAARLRRLGCDTAMGWYWTSAVDGRRHARHPARRRRRDDGGPCRRADAGRRPGTALTDDRRRAHALSGSRSRSRRATRGRCRRPRVVAACRRRTRCAGSCRCAGPATSFAFCTTRPLSA